MFLSRNGKRNVTAVQHKSQLTIISLPNTNCFKATKQYLGEI
jgi:hypothetical protein